MTATGRRVFESRTPTVIQPDIWSCAVSSATWCAQSVGVDITEPGMRFLMIPDLVTEALGLGDGSGGQMARLFRDHFGLQADNQRVISFDEAAARATSPAVLVDRVHALEHEHGARRRR